MYLVPSPYPYYVPHGMGSVMPPGSYQNYVPGYSMYPPMPGYVMPPPYGVPMMNGPERSNSGPMAQESYPPGVLHSRPPAQYPPIKHPRDRPNETSNNQPSTSNARQSTAPRTPNVRKYSLDGYVEANKGKNPSLDMRRRYKSDSTGYTRNGVKIGYRAPMRPNLGPYEDLSHKQVVVHAAANYLTPPPGSLDARKGPVDRLLEDFNSDKCPDLELKDIKGHMFAFAIDQHGSRFLQQKLANASVDALAPALDELLPYALQLMVDAFGNYVMQKFLDHGSPDMQAAVLQASEGHILALSLDRYGCRVVQKLLDVVDFEQRLYIASELEGHVMQCVRDQHGNHVVQKCFETLPSEDIGPLTAELLSSVVSLSTHPFGCRVVQRMLEHCTEQGARERLLGALLKAAPHLSADPFGNYVVQHVLQHGAPSDVRCALYTLTPHLPQLSCHKYGSNVVEACLLACPSGLHRDNLIGQVAWRAADSSWNPGVPCLEVLAGDQFGNYVVQRMLEVAGEKMKEELLAALASVSDKWRGKEGTRHALSRMERLIKGGFEHERSAPNNDEEGKVGP